MSEEMNSALLKPFSVEEIGTALHNMAPLKALGPDGFPACFFQSNWEILGNEICQAILGTLNSDIMPPFSEFDKYCSYSQSKEPYKCH